MTLCPASRTIRTVFALILVSLFCFAPVAAADALAGTITQADRNVLAQPKVTDQTVKIQTSYQGTLMEGRLVGPGLPPGGYQPTNNLADLTLMSAGGTRAAGMVDAAGVPAMTWTYGCSATSATMYYGYYDRNGYPNFYTGPTDNGVYPLTNAAWGASAEGNGESPLTASHVGKDGRVTKGHVDDYYGSYLSTFDPYYDNWTEHSPQDSIADYMGTNQYQNWYAVDGSTWFFNNGDGTPCVDFTVFETIPYPGFNHTIRDGNHGMKLFAESRGYNVTTNYNQYIYGYNGNTRGFTYAQYKAEIDSGNPVIIQVSGHTMLGVGYSGTDQVILHNTWDYYNHTMTWGGTYYGMQHYGVSVVELARANFTADTIVGGVPLAVQFTDLSTVSSPTEWNWSFGDGSSFVTSDPARKNAGHTYLAPGTYTVSLNVTNAFSSYTRSRPAYITAKPCVADFSANGTSGNAPVAVQFTDKSTGTITGWNWSFGDGNAWKEMTADAGWANREATASVVFPDGTIVLMGGASAPSRNNDTWRSTDYGATWTLVNASSGWTTRYGHTAVALPDGTIVLMGGYARS
ncbi:MAG: PKD domain-containing protein, partial [Methanoregula sp.]|nr:PKD domain-containing protein [Methanoregula sp.]